METKIKLSEGLNKTIKFYEKEFKISIIANCHNGEKYLSRCLKVLSINLLKGINFL